jgi:hypothetical protein
VLVIYRLHQQFGLTGKAIASRAYPVGWYLNGCERLVFIEFDAETYDRAKAI